MFNIRTNKFLEFISDWGSLIVLLYFVVTVLFAPNYKHMLNEQYIISATYVGPFLALFLFYVSLYRWQFQQKLIQKVSIIFGAIFAWIALCGGTAGLIVLINATFGVNNTHCFEGTVEEKWLGKSLSGELYYIRIMDKNTNVLRSLEVAEIQYQNLKTGSIFKECWVEGSLGLLYKEH